MWIGPEHKLRTLSIILRATGTKDMKWHVFGKVPWWRREG
jgi:hypothetical protein